jgi:hypothetical protein
MRRILRTGATITSITDNETHVRPLDVDDEKSFIRRNG